MLSIQFKKSRERCILGEVRTALFAEKKGRLPLKLSRQEILTSANIVINRLFPERYFFSRISICLTNNRFPKIVKNNVAEIIDFYEWSMFENFSGVALEVDCLKCVIFCRLHFEKLFIVEIPI